MQNCMHYLCGRYPGGDTRETARGGEPVTETIRVSEKPLPGFIRDRAAKGMLIGGDWTQAASGWTVETVTPATGSVLATVASGGRADVDRAVAAARRAFEEPSWASMN